MKETVQAQLTTLHECYNDQPVLKALLQLLPVGASLDSYLSTYVENIKRNRLKIFFDELNTGDIILTNEMIENNEFLHAYFATVGYVLRTRSDKKIKAFARILKKINTITYDDYEDYTAILNDLTERDFALLCIKYRYEKEYNEKRNHSTKVIPSYDGKFRNAACGLGINHFDLSSFIIRLGRTGCYKTNYKTSFGDNRVIESGETTALFKKIYRLVDADND